MAAKVRIAWRDLATGQEGRGDPISPRLAEEWLAELRGDKSHPSMTYWLEPVEDEP